MSDSAATGQAGSNPAGDPGSPRADHGRSESVRPDAAGTTSPNQPMRVEIDASLWGQIVFRVKESDDLYLRQLVEQAVAGGQMHV